MLQGQVFLKKGVGGGAGGVGGCMIFTFYI